MSPDIKDELNEIISGAGVSSYSIIMRQIILSFTGFFIN